MATTSGASDTSPSAVKIDRLPRRGAMAQLRSGWSMAREAITKPIQSSLSPGEIAGPRPPSGFRPRGRRSQADCLNRRQQVDPPLSVLQPSHHCGAWAVRRPIPAVFLSAESWVRISPKRDTKLTENKLCSLAILNLTHPFNCCGRVRPKQPVKRRIYDFLREHPEHLATFPDAGPRAAGVPS
jgi:hypothetical protein